MMKEFKLFTTMNVAILFLSLIFGSITGVGSFTFIYGKGWSYLTDDPKACMNCHIMTDQYNGWVKSSHHAVATCNSCHTPKNVFAKYMVKAINGYEHSLGFTTGNFPDPIRIKKLSFEITQNACMNCHKNIWESPRALNSSHFDSKNKCMSCHKSVGH